MDDEVLHVLALFVQMLLDGDCSEVDEFQDTSREQMVVVGVKVLVGIQHIVGLLQISAEGDIPIPEQIFVHFLSRTPNIYDIPDQSNEGYDKDAKDKGEDYDGVFGGPFLLVDIVAAFESLLSQCLETACPDICGLEHALVEAAHHDHGTTALKRLTALGDDTVIIEAHFALVTESPYTRVLSREPQGVLWLDSQFDMVGQGRDSLSHEHIVEAVGIVIAFHEVRHGITGGIGALAALA